MPVALARKAPARGRLSQDAVNEETGRLAWTAKPMTVRVDLDDKDAVHAALDRG